MQEVLLFTPILQMRRLRLGEARDLSQGLAVRGDRAGDHGLWSLELEPPHGAHPLPRGGGDSGRGSCECPKASSQRSLPSTISLPTQKV